MSSSVENITLRLVLTEDHIVKFRTVRHATVDELKQDVQTRCDLHEPFELMYMDKDFQEYFTLTEITVIENLVNVKVISKKQSTVPTTPLTDEVNSSSSRSTVTGPSPQDLHLRQKRISSNYTMPEFNLDIQFLLQECNKKNKETGEVSHLAHGPKSRILTRLAADIYEKYSAYPSSNDIEHVAKMLVSQ